MLRNAGLVFDIAAPAVNEGAIKIECHNRGLGAEETAQRLAATKALAVCPQYPGRLVLAGDQMLECDGRWFDKPGTRQAAAAQLGALGGRGHRLISAAVLARDGAVLWQESDSALMIMRRIGPAFIEDYLDAGGDALLGCVGVYQIEGLGAQLFQRIEGDFFTILGLPLLPVLGALRHHGVLGS